MLALAVSALEVVRRVDGEVDERLADAKDGVDARIVNGPGHKDGLGQRGRVARAAVHLGRIDTAIEQYRELLRLGLASDDVIDELNELCRDTADTTARRKLSRILGDAYARAGRIREAVDAYARAGGKP